MITILIYSDIGLVFYTPYGGLNRVREKWINKKSGQPCGVIHRGSQTKQKGWRRAEVVEPRKRLLGRQERGRALAQGLGDLLVRTVRGAPAAWGVEKWGGGGWARQRQRAIAAISIS